MAFTLDEPTTDGDAADPCSQSVEWVAIST
jgi:hypothetical protein